jgi:hypothetical protein
VNLATAVFFGIFATIYWGVELLPMV